jgi:mannose-1-phosphate guanylyltransferase/phosphomannomutase
MVPLNDKPVMEHIIGLLREQGITEIGVTLQYLPHVIEDYFGDGSEFGVSIKYFVEEIPLGTAGSVKNAEEFLGNDAFIIISGDALTDINLSEAVNAHNKNGATFTLVLKELSAEKIVSKYGVVATKNDGRITRFAEKPSRVEDVFSNLVNTGIYILEPSVLKFIPKGGFFDFAKDLFPTLMNNSEPLYGFTTSCYWRDIGDIDSYEEAKRDVLNGVVTVVS